MTQNDENLGFISHLTELRKRLIHCIVFLFSDPYSTPSCNTGKWIFGIIIGLSNALIRKYGIFEIPYTEAIVYAILLGNISKPLLDRSFIKP